MRSWARLWTRATSRAAVAILVLATLLVGGRTAPAKTSGGGAQASWGYQYVPDAFAGRRYWLPVLNWALTPSVPRRALAYDLILDDSWPVGRRRPPPVRAWKSASDIVQQAGRIRIPSWTRPGIHQIRLVPRDASVGGGDLVEVFVHGGGDPHRAEVVGVLIDSLAPGIGPLFAPDDGLALLSIVPNGADSSLNELHAQNGRVLRLSGWFGSGPGTIDFFNPEPTRNTMEVTGVAVEGLRVAQRTVYAGRTGFGADGSIVVLDSDASVRQFSDDFGINPAPDLGSINWAAEFVVAVTGTKGFGDLLPVMSYLDSGGRMQVHVREILTTPNQPVVDRGIVVLALPRTAGAVPGTSLTLNSLAYPAAPSVRTASLRTIAEQAIAR